MDPKLVNSWPWLGHIPFAFWSIEMARPHVFVELGTHTGTSYAAFCQAVAALNMPTLCYAIDTWEGDPHAGFYGDDVYFELLRYNTEHYSSFSRLIRSTFDGALNHFTDGTVDLLHIDGYHTYDALAGDFASWLPKLSRRGIVLCHDINVRERDFGAWRFWEEVQKKYPHFTFLHSNGLGVLAVGDEPPEPFRWLTSVNEESDNSVSHVRNFFTSLGLRINAKMESLTLIQDSLELKSRIANLEGELYKNNIQEKLISISTDLDLMAKNLLNKEKEILELKNDNSLLIDRNSHLSSENLEIEKKLFLSEQNEMRLSQSIIDLQIDLSHAKNIYKDEMHRLYSSTSWKITRPMRSFVFINRKFYSSLLIYLKSLRIHEINESSTYNFANEEKSQDFIDLNSSVNITLPVFLPENENKKNQETRISLIFVSGFPDTPSEYYRIFNPMETLKEFFEVKSIIYSQVFNSGKILETASVIIFFRCAWTNELSAIIDRARALGTLLVFDVDDFIFDLSVAEAGLVDGMRFLTDKEKSLYRDGVSRYRRLLKEADCCTFSTSFLQAQATLLGKTAFHLPNGISASTLWHFDVALAEQQGAGDSIVRIGYASGTKTHQRDFAVAAEALLAIMRLHDNVMITIIGEMDFEEFPEFQAFATRIEHRPLVPLDKLPMELRRIDINIAPLEVGNPFCEAKSQLKYFDAAMLEIPTVASPTGAFREAISSGVNGFLAGGTEEWLAHITALIEDRALRLRIGKCARIDALKRYGPAAVRENIKRTYRQILSMRRPITPRRGLGYDNFLYTINYPVQSLSAAPRTISNRLDRLKLHWIVPEFSAGAGGMTNILRLISHLEKLGHSSTIWVHNPWDSSGQWRKHLSDRYNTLVDTHFFKLEAKILPLPQDLSLIKGDAVIATDHHSAYPTRAVVNVRRRFYFLQDHESEFSPSGYAALFARKTYEFGFDALSNGAWLHELAQHYGMWSAMWEQAADREIYYPPSAPRQRGHIAFYYRRETPRRTVELGLLAFELLSRWNVDFTVDVFGGDKLIADLPYRVINHSVLSARELGDLYRTASAGMVFSATNYSIIPREMMACGLPVLELDSPSSRSSFPNAAAVLCDATPECVALNLRTLLLDETRRRQLSANAQRFAAGFSWEKSAGIIENAILTRLTQPTQI